MPRLRRVDCSGPGIVRKRRGRGFEYIDSLTGERVDDPETLARIRELVVPPAWKDVWICPFPFGHIQAVGTDQAGRKQYLYHQRWRERRDAEKFEHMLEFARALPAMRDVSNEHLRIPGLARERVLAGAVRLLDRGFFRIGTEGYAEQNQTYGLATIKKAHVTLDGNTITFDYVAKSGKRRIESVIDPQVAELVTALKRRRAGGDELLAYKRRDGGWSDVKSADINLYIKEITGGDFTAKDFRTWSATVLAAMALAVSGAATSGSGRKRAMTRAVKEVSDYLGNTPAVCRASYIDPRVFDRYLSGWTIALKLDAFGAAEVGEPSTQGEIEAAVIDLLEDRKSSELVEAVDELEKIA